MVASICHENPCAQRGKALCENVVERGGFESSSAAPGLAGICGHTIPCAVEASLDHHRDRAVGELTVMVRVEIAPDYFAGVAVLEESFHVADMGDELAR